MALSVKIVILQCMLTLLIGVSSAEATSDTQILLNDKLSVGGVSCSNNSDAADFDGNTDFNLFMQPQLDSTKNLFIHVSLFPPKKALGRFHSTPPIRAPPDIYS
jgi:hypothetical protein